MIEWLIDQDSLDDVDFDVNFFFKRDEDDWNSTSRFFFIITREFILKILKIDVSVAKMIAQNSLIFDKTLNEQFDKLIYQSLHQMNLTTNNSSIFIVIVDALNECEKERNVKAIIDLWSLLRYERKLFANQTQKRQRQRNFLNKKILNI